ncbi:FKBP-type peptidyl-prolyl cis-trans isomerase [Pontibacterium granulatum]|uniref:FKBP-type peptidyl-prolyl cis-trans isomerase n=1 Tax=Pontibacterium granulatum TaxID=2036029 RepID=UPI00249C0284|nr:FKBP-type peptidyl-prolyl cis-trans isomerase [Pontibacterium granulatum]MDI3325089.1 FKBP-type peptidyl-prolyl cis-trans isomerase [Pontibacterium granulatum]
MKKTWLAAALATALTAPSAFAFELTTEQQKLSYSLGLIVGGQLKQDVQDVDLEAFQQGVQTIYKDGEPLLTPEQVNQVMQAFQQRKMEEKRQAIAKLAQENLEKGQAYMAENGKKDGVTTTESGLQYEQLQAGNGKKPAATDNVEVHYRGTLVDGTEFDSSYARGETVTFPLNGVIPGWTEGVQLMDEGSKARLVIPSELAYGPGGMGNAIGPNETLVFEIELLKILPATEAAAQ